MLSKNKLLRLHLEEKRRVVRALLRSTFAEPRSAPLSYAQEQLWFMDKLQPGSPVYNIPLYIPFSGPFDLASLRRALEILTARHDMLRARFAVEDGQPVQIVEPEVAVELAVEDLSGVAAGDQHAALGRLLNAEVQTAFDLERGVCVRYKLYRLEPASHLLSVTMHHVITDAWSLGIFVSELKAAYMACRGESQAAPLPPILVEYTDYARWQRATLRGLRLRKLVSYWTNQLAGAPHVLHLPTDHARRQDQTFNGTVTGFVFDDQLSAELIALSRRYKVTPFMLLLACYYALLYRYSGQEDIVVGAPVANRGRPELEPIIGIFVNTLIMRVRLHDALTFAELVAEVQKVSLGAFQHQALPFPKLVDELNVERVPGYPPLYQVVFNFQNASLIESANPSAEGETMADGRFPFVHSNTAKVDLNLTVTQNGSRISGGIEYNTDLFEPETIGTMISHYRMIAEAVTRDPAIAVMDIVLDHGSGDAAEAGGPVASSIADPAQGMDLGRFSFELGSPP
ncbi:MAG TPA: condensation domain-containing protein [Kofleriaceae bacterium]